MLDSALQSEALDRLVVDVPAVVLVHIAEHAGPVRSGRIEPQHTEKKLVIATLPPLIFII